MGKILIIDDEKEVATFLTYLFKEKGYDVDVGYNGKDFDRLLSNRYDVAMLDVKLPDSNGLDLLKRLKKRQPYCKSVVMTGYSTVKVAVEAIKLGANDYIEKPFDEIGELENLIDGLMESGADTFTQHDEIASLTSMSGIIFGKNEKMKRLLSLAYKIAPKNVNVLIHGETGTGKELLAHFIHLASRRNEQPFISVNCGALSETLLESELFGHEKGAFTGATRERKGIFEIAHNGTLFLDEVGDAAPSTQVKLLRVVETGEFMRVGGEKVQKTNTRIISATNVNLEEAVEKGKFREDLLYRLNVVSFTLPPLRERKEDIPLIAEYFAKKYHEAAEIRDDAMEILLEYDWPGNIRELSNVMKHALSLLDDGDHVITPDLLPENVFRNNTSKAAAALVDAKNDADDFNKFLTLWVDGMLDIWERDEIVPLDAVLENVRQLETYVGKAYVLKALKETIGDRKRAAERLKTSERRLRYILNEKGKQS